MSIKELHKLLSDMINERPECASLPVRLELTDDEENYDQASNYWLTDYELHSTGISGYEEEGELKLIGEQ
tara:strand:- start:2245 stop:2454 length:210 start_codon:yes stop_codon:yes gene_type:complete